MANVFAVIGDETRRSLLERLRLEGPLSLSDLADPLPMTRQAVTKHLDALEEVGLVRRRRVGRERIHVLDATPMKAVGDWLAPYEAAWDARLSRLGAHLRSTTTEGGSVHDGRHDDVDDGGEDDDG